MNINKKVPKLHILKKNWGRMKSIHTCNTKYNTHKQYINQSGSATYEVKQNYAYIK